MNNFQTQYQSYDVASRDQFITKTYVHLFGAVIAFMAVSGFFYQAGISERIAKLIMSSGSSWAWLAVLGAFTVVSWIATSMADSFDNKPMQYGGLALYVGAESLIFCPVLYIAAAYFDGVILQAGLITLTAFLGLTAIVFITRKDFSFMKGFLMFCGIMALVAIVASVLFGFQLGVWFSAAMVLFAGGVILYQTSNVLHHYREDQYVSASLALFASVAMLFWYVLQLVMAFTGED